MKERVKRAWDVWFGEVEGFMWNRKSIVNIKGVGAKSAVKSCP